MLFSMFLHSHRDLRNLHSFPTRRSSDLDVRVRYINVLMNDCKNSTIKYKVKNVKQFINKLNVNRVYQDVNYAFISDVALSTRSLRDDSSRTRKMTKEDLESLKEWFVNERYAEGRHSYKGKIYATLVDFMFVT